MSLLQSGQDGNVLPIVCDVVLFGISAYLRGEHDQSENTETVGVVEKAVDQGAAGMSLKNDQLSWFEIPENGSICEGSL